MNTTARRVVYIFLLLVACIVALAAYIKFSAVLPRRVYLSGWVLLAVMIILAVYNGRKKLPFLPLGTSKGWLRFHVYAGYFTILLFLIHTRFRLPQSRFDMVLASLYLLVTLSGIVGLFISRSFPRRLTTRGGEVIFEQIPVVRRNLRERAEALTLKSVSEMQSSTIADFYVEHLKDFFAGPENFWLHLVEVRTPIARLQKKMDDLNRFLNENERAVMQQVANLVRQKDGIDYHYSLQMMLKIWLFVHIPLTYSLLIFSFIHVVLVYAFSGGAG